MVCCDNCDRWVHMECDNVDPLAVRHAANYNCPTCRAAHTGFGTSVDAAVAGTLFRRQEVLHDWHAHSFKRVAEYVTMHHAPILALYPQILLVRTFEAFVWRAVVCVAL